MSRLFSGTPFEQPIKCDTCGKYTAECRCIKSSLPPKKKMSAGNKPVPSTAYQLTPENSDPPKDQIAKVTREKRKGGRTVTVIKGLDHPANDLPQLCTDLKSKLATGGSVQDRTIELQGDHSEAVKVFFDARSQKSRVL